MSVILGIDPGSRITGFGVIQQVNHRFYYIASGCIRAGTDGLPFRLHRIYEGLSKVIKKHQPQHASVEKVFMSKNPDSALKLGHARGVAIIAAIQYDVEVYEYSAREIKSAVVGKGAADKQQVQHMVMALLKLDQPPQIDAADALASALCHGYTLSGQHKFNTYANVK